MIETDLNAENVWWDKLSSFVLTAAQNSQSEISVQTMLDRLAWLKAVRWRLTPFIAKSSTLASCIAVYMHRLDPAHPLRSCREKTSHSLADQTVRLLIDPDLGKIHQLSARLERHMRTRTHILSQTYGSKSGPLWEAACLEASWSALHFLLDENHFEWALLEQFMVPQIAESILHGLEGRHGFLVKDEIEEVIQFFRTRDLSKLRKRVVVGDI